MKVFRTLFGFALFAAHTLFAGELAMAQTDPAETARQATGMLEEATIAFAGGRRCAGSGGGPYANRSGL